MISTAEKIMEGKRLTAFLDDRRASGEGIVFTNGCFDIIHAGHVDYLEKARNLGGALIVGLNTDRSVREIKGPTRPIVPQEQRARVVAALACVDCVTLFDEPDPLKLIMSVGPDVLVKGADWPLEKIVGADRVMAGGGRVERIEFTTGLSTSSIIDRIRRLSEK